MHKKNNNEIMQFTLIFAYQPDFSTFYLKENFKKIHDCIFHNFTASNSYKKCDICET